MTTMGLVTGNDKLKGNPDMLCYWQQWQGSVDCNYTGRSWAASELRALSEDIVEKLAKAGLRKGDIVALLLANTVAFPLMLISLLELGCNPLLMYVATQAPELKRIVEEFGIRWVVHDFLEGLSHLPHTGHRKVTHICVGNIPVSILSTAATIKNAACNLPVCSVVLHPTSGTYGLARYCIRNQRVAVAEANNYLETIGFYRNIRITVTTPLSHAFAYGFGLISALLSHSTLVLYPAFNPKRLLRKEKEQPSDILAIVPPMTKPLVQIGSLDSSPSMAKTVFYAGAPCARPLAEQFETTFNTPLFCIYGTTETGAISSSYDSTGRLPGVGRPLKNVTIEILHGERYANLGDRVGEIHVKSTSIMQGYTPDAAGHEVSNYWPTGDIGFIDAANNLKIVGRIKDVINLGGMKVDPHEVENVLLAHPCISDAAVYPGLRADSSEFVQAAIRLDGRDINADELSSYCLDMLDTYKVPHIFHFVDQIPRLASGKCLKCQCPGFPKRLITP